MKRMLKKVLISSLVFGLVFSSISVLTIGASKAELKAKLVLLHDTYMTDDQIDDVRAARDAIQAIRVAVVADNNVITTTYADISDSLWIPISEKITSYISGGGSSNDVMNVTEENVFLFALNLGSFTYDPEFLELETLRTDSETFLSELALLAGIDSGLDNVDLTYDDLYDFYLELEAAAGSALQSIPTIEADMDQIELLIHIATVVNEVKDVVNSSTTKTAEVLSGVDITGNDLIAARMAIIGTLGSVGVNAELALIQAYQAMIIATAITPTTVPVTVIPTLPQQASEVAKEVLADLVEKLATLPASEKKAEVKKAEKAVEKAIKEAGKASVPVVVTAGVAKPTIDTAALVNKAKEAKALADTLNADLVASGGKKAEVEFTMDLGTVEADDVEISLGKAFLAELTTEGVDTNTLAVNGVEITVDSNEFEEDTTLSIQKKSKEESGDVSGKTAASDYYEFDFTSNGSLVGQFKKPVRLKLPVINVDNIDTDLLTLAKVHNGKLIYYVGKYNAELGSVVGIRDSFSTYVIVENKVEFNDIASVKSWAGRYIEVAAAKGVIVGRAEGEFVPAANVTRAEFAKMIVTAFSLSSSNTSESFDDVSDTQWFKPYVATAFSNGIISGRTATTFDPNAPITRQEMAAMVARILKSSLDVTDATDANAELSIYSDADTIGSVFTASVALATEQGILTGSAGTFKPLGITTRAEAAVVITKLIELL